MKHPTQSRVTLVHIMRSETEAPRFTCMIVIVMSCLRDAPKARTGITPVCDEGVYNVAQNQPGSQG